GALDAVGVGNSLTDGGAALGAMAALPRARAVVGAQPGAAGSGMQRAAGFAATAGAGAPPSTTSSASAPLSSRHHPAGPPSGRPRRNGIRAALIALRIISHPLRSRIAALLPAR